MRTYTLENKSYKWLLYLGILQIVLGVGARIISNYTGYSSLINIISAIMDVLWFASFPISAIIAGFVAKKLNQTVLLWGIFTLILSPIALIILSKKKLYIKPEINPIYRKYEIKYLDLLSRIKIDLRKEKITHQEFVDKKKVLLKETELTMNREIKEKEIKIVEQLNKPIPDIKNPIYPDSEESKVAYDKCPACGTKIIRDEFECSDCGLRLK